jgi:hypothetical protein
MMTSRSEMAGVLVTSGARRGCGTREPGGAYLAVPLGPDGRPVEDFLIDPPILCDAKALGLSAVGVTLVERDGVTHVLDIVGREHYRTVAGFVEEARRLGVSRRIAKTSEFSRIGPASRLILLHAHADIANALDFPTSDRCPCEVDEHLAAGFGGMCARLWWDEPLQAARHRLAVFASFPIAQIEVASDPAGGTHVDAIERASAAGVPVIEVEK